MSRLIDADKLKRYIPTRMDMQDLYLPVHFKTLIDEQPTVDAVEVVRCADCKWCGWIYRKEKSLDTLVCDRFDRDVKYDWFCADGER